MEEHIYKLPEELIKGISEKIEIPILRRCFTLMPTGKEINDRAGNTYTEMSSFTGTKYTKDTNGVLRRISKKVSSKRKKLDKI